MRIVFHTHVFAPSVGGVETQILSLARGLHGRATRSADEKLEATVLTAQPAGDFDDREVPFRVVREPGLGAIVAWFRRADIVHLAGPSFAPLLAALALRRRVIVSHHGFQAACPNGQFFYGPTATLCPGHFRAGRHKECLKCNAGSGRWQSLVMWLATFPRRYLCQKATLNLVPTRWLGTVLELPRTAAVPHGVAGRGVSRAAESPTQPKFSFVGRLVSTKGVAALLAAAQCLKAKGHSFQFYVIGEGPERQALEARAKRGGLNGTVEFLGSVTPKQIEQELAGSLAVVVPSLAGEVFGLVAAESMMAGRAVVTSDIGALREVSGDTGLSFPAGDADALAERLERLLRTPGLAARLGEQAGARAQELYGLEQMVSKHIRLYEKVMSEAGWSDQNLPKVSMKPPTLKLDDERLHPDTQDRATFHHHLARYQFARERLAGGERILDAGCGTGYGTALLAERGSYALGFDYSPLAIEYARTHFAGPKLSYAVMNAQQLAVAAATFDVVISFEVFEHLEDSEAFLAECRRVLRPGGRLILSTPNQETHDLHMNSIGMKNEFHINLMNEKNLKAALRRHFNEVEIYGQRRKGSRIYSTLRALDVFNLRLRVFSSQRRESLQQHIGVPVAPQAQAGAWIFSKHQLRQANTFVAVCRKS